MRFTRTNTFKKLYRKLPQHLQHKTIKQLGLLEQNLFHPSLNTKKQESTDRWEIRVDYHNRLTFDKVNDEIILRTIGPHDKGLGKK